MCTRILGARDSGPTKRAQDVTSSGFWLDSQPIAKTESEEKIHYDNKPAELVHQGAKLSYQSNNKADGVIDEKVKRDGPPDG